jgi:hypothetical protein
VIDIGEIKRVEEKQPLALPAPVDVRKGTG